MLRAPLFRICVLLAALLLVPGCRTAGTSPALGSTHVSSSHDRASLRSSADILARAEIQTVPVNTAFDAVSRLRPEFLKRHGTPAHGDPQGDLAVVYLDGVRQGGPDMLRSIPVAAVFEIRFLTAGTASDRFGAYHPGGVIAVRTKP